MGTTDRKIRVKGTMDREIQAKGTTDQEIQATGTADLTIRAMGTATGTGDPDPEKMLPEPGRFPQPKEKQEAANPSCDKVR